MKKTFSLVLTLALTVAIAVGAATTAFAHLANKDCDDEYCNTDEGYVTMDTAIFDNGDGTFKTVRDLFWTGSVGSAESSGTLDIYSDTVTWTLKDGVLILKGHLENRSRADVSIAVLVNSPFWNNEYIETIVIDSDIYSTGGTGTLFGFGLPNLKTVIFLGETVFYVKGTLGGMTGRNIGFGDFPTDHEINYIWETCHASNNYVKALGYPSAVGTSTEISDFTSANAFFTDRPYYLAAAAPVVARATMTKEAVDMLPEDMVAAVAAIGGFKSFGGNPASTAPVNVTSDINVTVNGTPVVWTDAVPFIDENDRTMVPLRAVADAMGLDVEWDANMQTATFTRGDDYIMFMIGFTSYWTNNDHPSMDTVPVIRNDRTYAPIRYLAEFFGYTVDWDGATQTVIITS